MAVTVPQPVLEGARWSSAVMCPRRAVYEHQGAPGLSEDETSERIKRWRRRGHAIAAAIRGDIMVELRAENRRPRAEEEIPWPAADPIGVGHADLYVPHERHLIEVTSTAGADLDAHKALQVAGYQLEHPNAEHASVCSVDPSTFEERWYPINVAALEPQIRAIQDAVVTGCRGGDLPDRVCEHPGEAESRFCPFAGVCFEGWTRPEPDVLLLDQEAVELASATDQVAQAKQALADAEAARDERRAQLRRYLPAGQVFETKSVRKLKRIEVAGRKTLSLSKMAAAGVALPAELEPFLSEGKPHDRYTIERAETTPPKGDAA